MMTSPAGRTASSGRLALLEEQHQQQHMHQQQQLQHQLQQQQQQLHMPHPAPDAMQQLGGMMHMASGGMFAGPMQQQAMGHNVFAAPAAAGGMQ